MLAMLRSCWEALSSRAREMTGYTPGCRATSLIRSSAPIRRPSLVSMPRNGSALMSRTCCGVTTLSFIRSTRVVPPARKVPGEARAASTVAGAVSSNGRIGPPRLVDGGHDVRVRRAAADVAGHELPDVLDVLLDRRDPRHALAGRAEPALRGGRGGGRRRGRGRPGRRGRAGRRGRRGRRRGGRGEAGERGPAGGGH